jgi:hypothetical protein
MVMDVTRKKRVTRDWSAVFADFDGSGMTIKDFCLSKGMSQSLFYRRRKDYADCNTSPQPSLGRKDFIELTPGSAPQHSASISFPGQITLTISNDCDRELLRLIISQLKESPC